MTDVVSDHPAARKLRADGASDAAIRFFGRQVARVAAGETGELPEAAIEPVDTLPDADAFAEPGPARARELLEGAVVVKLNGGLGTSMGLAGPKGLLEVRDGLTFLDVIARQVLALRERSGVSVPLVLMNSFATRDPSMARLEAYDLPQNVPLDFLQGRVPKLRADNLLPAEHPADPEKEWAPPGHGDLYPSLVGSGMLDKLLGAGVRRAFVSNADNLGATLDLALLSWFADSGAPFLMEAADRTTADRKGGHLARGADGGLLLRELAQTPDEDAGTFQDVGRHRFFNTNNLWIDLQALRAALDAAGGALDLPLIVNRKTVDPKDDTSTPVVQLETAMGAALGLLGGAQAVRVARTRMAPVKTTNDLLAIRSDAYVLDADSRVLLAASRAGVPPEVDLDPGFFKRVDAFEERFAQGVPSLVGCQRLEVVGEVTFGKGVEVRGRVRVEGPTHVADGTVLEEGA